MNDYCALAAAFFAGIDVDNKHHTGRHHLGALVLAFFFFGVGLFLK